MKITVDFEEGEVFQGSEGEALCNILGDACKGGKPVSFAGVDALVIRCAVNHSYVEPMARIGRIESVEFDLIIVKKPD